MSTDDISDHFHNSAGASKLVHGKKRSIKVWNVTTIKYIELGLDLSSEITTKCMTAI
jgi:hypothetical protein